MDIFLISINILIFLAIGGLVLLAKNYLPSYIKEKGKNLATKEDIEIITIKVEAIKTEFIKETEVLKANLQLISKTRQSLISLERDALINFHEKYFRWFNMCTDSYCGGIDTYDQEQIDNYLVEIDKSKVHADIAEAKMELLVDDAELIELKNDLKLKTLKEISRLPKEYLPKLKPANVALKSSKKDLASLSVDKNLMEVNNKIYSEYCSKIIEHYKNIIPVFKEFQKKSREYLNKIFTESETLEKK